MEDQLAALYSRRSGLSLERAQSTLEGLPLDLCEKILSALRYQSDSLLYDPIEDVPGVRQLVESAMNEAFAAPDLAQHRWVPGYSFLFSEKAKQILAAKHGIAWYPRSAMNPHILFD